MIARFFRKTNRRTPNVAFMLVCEGKTEVAYFRGLHSEVKPKVHIKLEMPGGNQMNLMEYAIAAKSQTTYDEIWCVFDLDTISIEESDRVRTLADDNKIKIAYSNPSFEFWYLLHYGYFDIAISSKDCERKLSAKLKAPYKKPMNDAYAKFRSKQETAIRNSERRLQGLDNPSSQPVQANPSTNVHLLVRAIIKASKG